MSSPLELVISRLEIAGSTVKQAGLAQWTAQCPSHDDRHASLSIGVGEDGRVLLHCHASCGLEDVLDALGVAEAALFPDVSTHSHNGATRTAAVATTRPDVRPRLAVGEDDAAGWHRALLARRDLLGRLGELRGWTPEAIGRFGIGYDGERVTIPVSDRGGQLTGLLRYQPNPEKRNGTPKMLALEGSVRDLFPGPETIGNAELLWLVEGEPDAVALWSMGIPAVGYPGAGKRDDGWAARFAGRRVVVCCDCDPDGREAGAWWAEALEPHAADVWVLDLDKDRHDKYDVGDLIREWLGEGAAIETLRSTLERMAKGARREAQKARQRAGTATVSLAESSPDLPNVDAQDAGWPVLVGCDRPPFPVDVLPATIKDWVLAEAEESQTPPDLAALAALAVLSAAAVGPMVDCGDWIEESIALYLLVALPSGDRKSTVLRAAKAPLQAWEDERQRDARPRFLELKARRDGLDARIKKLTKRLATAIPRAAPTSSVSS